MVSFFKIRKAHFPLVVGKSERRQNGLINPNHMGLTTMTLDSKGFSTLVNSKSSHNARKQAVSPEKPNNDNV